MIRYYKSKLFDKYIYDDKENVFISYQKHWKTKKVLKKYYSSVCRKWRYKLKTINGDFLQFNEKRLKAFFNLPIKSIKSYENKNNCRL